MNILITNTTMLNSGDAAILLSLIDLLRSAFGKNVHFIIYDRQPEVASRYYPDIVFRKSLYWGIRERGHIKYFKTIRQCINILNFRIGVYFWIKGVRLIARAFLSQKMLQYLTEYSTADMIISTGGTYLVENYSIKPRIFDYNISLYMGIPLIFFTQSLGPFSIRSNRRSLKCIFERSILILLRDKKSRDNLLDLGVNNANIHIIPDSVFALADVSAIDAAMNLESYHGQIQKIAISVRDWKYFKMVSPDIGRKKYLEALQALSVHLVEKYNARITYVSTCQGIPEYRYDDSRVAMEIFEMLPDRVAGSVTIDKKHYTPKDLMKTIKKYDMVISTRMHMAILALGVGIPVFPIAYEFKTRELFERLGQGYWVQDIEGICAESLISLVDSFIKSLPRIRKKLFYEVEQAHKHVLMSGEIVKKAVEQWKHAYTSSR